MTHQAQAADSAAGISSEVDDQPIALELRDRTTDVAGDVHPEDSREHTDADQSDARRQFRRGDDLIWDDDWALLLFRARYVNRRPQCRPVWPPNVKRARLA